MILLHLLWKLRSAVSGAFSFIRNCVIFIILAAVVLLARLADLLDPDE